MVKRVNKGPVSIKSITLEYENGTRLVVNEGRVPKIGKLFFDSINENAEIEWRIIEKGNIFSSSFQSLRGFFTI